MSARVRQIDWDPRSDAIQNDQIAGYDTMRGRCPVARSAYGYTSVFRHADVLRVLEDHATFSSAVSRFPSVPNGMDPPDHTAFRALIDPYFTPARVDEFDPVCQDIAGRLANRLGARAQQGPVDIMGEFATAFAVQVQCAFMGWPGSLHQPLLDWTRKNHQATLSRDEHALAAVALEFDSYIRAELATRRAGAGPCPYSAADTETGDTKVTGSDTSNAQTPNARPQCYPPDVTTRLLHERVNGRPLTDDEIVSIVRNWTVGELGTIAASIGILVHYLATQPSVQRLVRKRPDLLPAAIDEILRIHPPLILNRRVATRDTHVGDTPIAQGERLAVLWASANRDESVFGDPDEFRLDRDPELNLLYGKGIHVCPGAALARRELLIAMRTLLKASRIIALDSSRPPVKSIYPSSGFSSLSVSLGGR